LSHTRGLEGKGESFVRETRSPGEGRRGGGSSNYLIKGRLRNDFLRIGVQDKINDEEKKGKKTSLKNRSFRILDEKVTDNLPDRRGGRITIKYKKEGGS